ncbi:MAG TPA: carbamoyltransferase C-terminal domain-containing protein [Vicinamibacteria bacterium]|nr:carbamoyltransferase C-terminal domain-containing protein [Vicinamibacteria bacterium]
MLGIIAVDVGGHPSACLLKDGRLVAFAEEERFARVKQAPGLFPSQAVRYCLAAGGLSLADVDHIAFGWDANAYRWRFPLFLARSFLRHKLRGNGHVPRLARNGRPALGSAVVSGLRSLLSLQPSTIRENLVLGLRDAGQKVDRLPPLTFVKHHLAHAASAFWCSGYEDAAVLVFDGHGEENSTTIFRGEGRTLTLLQEINIPHSLGWYYSAFTEYLGWSPNEGEVKLMGLAPFGRPDPEIEAFVNEVLRPTDDGFRLEPSYLFYGQRSQARFFSDALVARLGPPRGRYEEIADRHRDLARAVQGRLEEVGLHLARLALRKSGKADLCLAGGVALNCKMNGAIHKSGVARRLFVQPLAYDAGVSLGAALVVAMDKGDEARFRMDHLHWGPEHGDDEIASLLRENRIPFRQCPDVPAQTARLLADGRIVGWFQGRMECGPRALGGRSILADPRDAGMKDAVNDRVKLREPWRPFALSILEEHFPEYVLKPAESPFMVMAFDVREEKRPDIPSAMHWVDGTTRPQTVSRKVNPRYWEAIEEFRRLTGVPAVLNTSFNVKDEPMVCTPRDAIRCFFGTGMDALVIGDCIVEKAR